MNNVQKARDYLSEIGTFISNSDVTIHCGHPMIDAVLGSKVALARKLGFDIVHTVSLGSEIGMEPFDLCSILGNVMDNAIEACARIEDADTSKRIEVCIHDASGDLQISIVNTMVPLEVRKKPAFHVVQGGQERGIGLSNVKKTVQKYMGTLSIDMADGQFRIRIVIPISKRAQ